MSTGILPRKSRGGGMSGAATVRVLQWLYNALEDCFDLWAVPPSLALGGLYERIQWPDHGCTLVGRVTSEFAEAEPAIVTRICSDNGWPRLYPYKVRNAWAEELAVHG